MITQKDNRKYWTEWNFLNRPAARIYWLPLSVLFLTWPSLFLSVIPPLFVFLLLFPSATKRFHHSTISFVKTENLLSAGASSLINSREQQVLTTEPASHYSEKIKGATLTWFLEANSSAQGMKNPVLLGSFLFFWMFYFSPCVILWIIWRLENTRS